MGHNLAADLLNTLKRTTPIVTVKIVRLTFKTDHEKMTDYDTDWKSSGLVASKPEWNYGHRSAAVSHTRGQGVTTSVDVEVYPTNADPVPCNFEGTAPFGSVKFVGTITLKGGTIPMTAISGAITLSPNTVAKLTGDITWTFTPIAGGPGWGAGSSWGHTIYTTMGMPIAVPSPDYGVTRKRMDKAIELVSSVGSDDPNKIVETLMSRIKYYTLVNDPAVPAQYNHPKYFNTVGGAWPISEYIEKYAECQAIVRWVRALIKQVGCAGTADLVTIWADPNIDNGRITQVGENDPDLGLDTTKTVGGKTWTAALVDRV